MAPAVLNDALKEFHLTLEELKNNLEFLRIANRVRPRLGQLLAWDQLKPEGKLLAQTFVSQRSVNVETAYNGLLIILAGAFETYVRRLVRDVILVLKPASVAFGDLSERLRNQNVARTGQALMTVHEPLDHYQFDYEVLAKNLATCVTGTRDYVLNADVFTIDIFGGAEKQIEQSAKRLGFQLNWDQLGASRQMQKILDTKNSRETGTKIKDHLLSFSRIRNKIAHTGGQGVSVTDTDLDQQLKFFGSFATPLRDVIARNVKT